MRMPGQVGRRTVQRRVPGGRSEEHAPEPYAVTASWHSCFCHLITHNVLLDNQLRLTPNDPVGDSQVSGYVFAVAWTLY